MHTSSRTRSLQARNAAVRKGRTWMPLEALESRALLSVTIVNAKTATFTDVDGDSVTVAITKGTLTAGLFTTAASGLGEQLQELDLSGAGFAGTNLTISVKQFGTGNGLTNVGYINAGTNALGKTVISGDLGRINAGSSNKAGITSLTVFSMGRQGTSSQAIGGTLISNITTLRALTVTTDIDEAFVNVNGNIGNIKVGGSLIGGTAANSGSIQSAIGNIGSVFIGQNLFADTDVSAIGATNSAFINATHGSVGNVTIIGSVIGGAAESSGRVFAFNTLGKVAVGGDVQGGGGHYSGELDGFTDTSISINGSLIGGAGDESGYIYGGKAGNITIGGSIIGGAGNNSGAVFVSGDIAKIVVSQNIIGGDFSGAGSLNSGSIEATGKIGSALVGGNVIAGNNTGGGILESGTIRAGTTVGSVQINGSLIGNTTLDAIISAAGVNSAKGGIAITSVTIGGKVDHGSILAGYSTNQDNFILGAVNGGAQIGKITVLGDWIASFATAGIDIGPDLMAGTNDDIAIAGVGSGKGKIGSVVIAGQIFGTAASGDHYAIVSSLIGAVSVAGVKIPLTAGIDSIGLGGTDDVTILEV